MKKVETGTVFAIPVERLSCYGYGKYVHLSHITGSTYDSHIFKVYDYFTKTPYGKLEDITNSELLYGPFLLARRPKYKGLGWKIVWL